MLSTGVLLNAVCLQEARNGVVAGSVRKVVVASASGRVGIGLDIYSCYDAAVALQLGFYYAVIPVILSFAIACYFVANVDSILRVCVSVDFCCDRPAIAGGGASDSRGEILCRSLEVC